jgi:hypothetical protein
MKLFVAVPVHRELPVDFATCWLKLAQARDLPFEVSGHFLPRESDIRRARNRLSADFLATDCSHCLWIDCDIIFTTRDVERLASHDEAIVGGFCPLKLDGELMFAAEALPGSPPPDERGLLPLRYIGAGFLLVRRDGFKGMLSNDGEQFSYVADRTGRPEYDFWRAGVYRQGRGQPGRYLPEDFSLCQCALNLGFKVYGDTRVVLKHIGSIPYPATSEEVRWDGGRFTEFVSKGTYGN